jgi:hypothetical protein
LNINDLRKVSGASIEKKGLEESNRRLHGASKIHYNNKPKIKYQASPFPQKSKKANHRKSQINFPFNPTFTITNNIGDQQL